jgi:hypothetical protein
MKSRFAGAGYALIDNRASDWGNVVESDVLVCGGCQAVLYRHDTIDHRGRVTAGWAADGAWCHRCDKPLCAACGAAPCPPECGGFEKRFRRLVEEQYRREQNARLFGI